MILVSGCLSGNNMFYNGAAKINGRIRKLVESGKAIPVCPELLGGLPIPRERSEIAGGTGEDVLSGKCKVISEGGKDFTVNFINGAKAVLAIAKKYNIKKAVLKSNSPACGCGRIYDGTFTGRLIAGDGVACAILKKNNIEVMSDRQFCLKTLEITRNL